jgi:hypothetical protein
LRSIFIYPTQKFLNIILANQATILQCSGGLGKPAAGVRPERSDDESQNKNAEPLSLLTRFFRLDGFLN